MCRCRIQDSLTSVLWAFAKDGHGIRRKALWKAACQWVEDSRTDLWFYSNCVHFAWIYVRRHRRLLFCRGLQRNRLSAWSDCTELQHLLHEIYRVTAITHCRLVEVRVTLATFARPTPTHSPRSSAVCLCGCHMWMSMRDCACAGERTRRRVRFLFPERRRETKCVRVC